MLSNQGCIQFGFADLNDIQVQFRRGQDGKFLTQTFDVCTFLTDNDTRTGSMDRDTALFVRTFNDDLADTRLRTFFLDEGLDL